MSNRPGRAVKGVYLGTNKIAEIGEFSLSGFTREVLDASAFGDDIKKFEFGQADGGEITFTGLYDPTDTNGQTLLESAAKNASKFTGGDLKFYVDNTSYWTVDTGGNILVTKVKAVKFDKAGLGQVEFSAKVSGAAMVLI